MEEKEFPRVTIVILPFDNYQFFVRALDSVRINTDYPNFEIIISHNPCSNEETNSAIRNLCNENYKMYGIKSVFNKTNLYHGPGCMKGVEIADPESKYIGLLNDDVFVPGYGLDWLSKMVEYMEEHPNVATVTPMLFHLKNTVFWCGRIPGKAEHLYLHLPKGDPRLPREPFMTESNNMAFCIVRAELLREFRMDDPGVPVHYGSDSAFYNRVQRKYPNMKHFVLPQIQLYHENIYWARTNREDPNISG